MSPENRLAIVAVSEINPGQVRRLRKGITGLVFQGDGRSDNGSARLKKVLESWPGRTEIEDLRFDENCRGSRSEIISLFPKLSALSLPASAISSLQELRAIKGLRSLHLITNSPTFSLDGMGGMSIRTLSLTVKAALDLRPLASASTIDVLSVLGWKDPDLSAISQVRLNHLKLVGGALRKASGIEERSYKLVEFLRCVSLSSLGSFTTIRLTLDTCNKLDTESIANVRGVKDLSIRNLKQVGQLKFLRRCESLQSLSIVGSQKLKDQALADILASKNLRRVMLYAQSRGEAESLSKARPELLILSREDYFTQGRKISSEEWSSLDQKLLLEIYGPMDDWQTLDNP
jgi:hypothetical protein